MYKDITGNIRRCLIFVVDFVSSRTSHLIDGRGGACVEEEGRGGGPRGGRGREGDEVEDWNRRFGGKETPLELWDIEPEWTVSGRKKVRRGRLCVGK